MVDTSTPVVLVTGATGFIGGWVVEAMHLSGRYTPIAALRSWGSAVRVARYAPELRFADILKPETLDEAMKGCDYVVHAAVGDDSTTIDGTQNVINAARKAGIKRVVHISTISVYGNREGVFTESEEFSSDNTAYGNRKIAAEKIALAANGDGLEVTALRPTIVYGPYSTQWTINFAQRLLSGKWGTFGNRGEGICNLVYIGDVVRAVFSGIESAGAPGEVFNINGPDSLTWNEYFIRFGKALGIEQLNELNPKSNKLKAQAIMPVRTFGKYMLNNHRKLVMYLYKSSSLVERMMQSTEVGLKLTPTPDQLELYGRKASFPSNKAMEEIGYIPLIGVDAGLEMSVLWLRHHGLLPEGEVTDILRKGSV